MGREQALDAAASLHRRVAMLQDACRAAMTVQELVEIAVAQARVAVTAAAGVLFQLDGEDLVPAVSHGYSTTMMEKWARTRVDDSTPAGRAVLTHEAVWLLDPAEKVRAFPALAPSATGYAALAALPLMASGTVLGVLGVSFAVARPLDPVERLYLLVLADQVGEAMHRLRPAPVARSFVDHDLLSDPDRVRVAEDVRTAMLDADEGVRDWSAWHSTSVVQHMLRSPSSDSILSS